MVRRTACTNKHCSFSFVASVFPGKDRDQPPNSTHRMFHQTNAVCQMAARSCPSVIY
jgi:hypothetical protein